MSSRPLPANHRSGVNALYLSQAVSVGGTGNYHASVECARPKLDSENETSYYSNPRKPGASMVPSQPTFNHAPQAVRGGLKRGRRECCGKRAPCSSSPRRLRLDVTLHPASPGMCGCGSVPVFTRPASTKTPSHETSAGSICRSGNFLFWSARVLARGGWRILGPRGGRPGTMVSLPRRS